MASRQQIYLYIVGHSSFESSTLGSGALHGWVKFEIQRQLGKKQRVGLPAKKESCPKGEAGGKESRQRSLETS